MTNILDTLLGTQTVSGTVTQVTRRGNTVIGNPVWTITVQDAGGFSHVLRTRANAAVGHRVTFGLEGQSLTFGLTRAGSIVDFVDTGAIG